MGETGGGGVPTWVERWKTYVCVFFFFKGSVAEISAISSYLFIKKSLRHSLAEYDLKFVYHHFGRCLNGMVQVGIGMLFGHCLIPCCAGFRMR